MDVCIATGDKKMKLWLDDVRPMPYDYDVHVKTAGRAIQLIKAGFITEVSLDNDLGDVYWDDSPTGEGRHVADFIEQGAYEGTVRRIKCHIHTDNVVARMYMEQAILNANFYWDKKERE